MFYCWWKKSGDHQLRLVVYPIICQVLNYIPGGPWFHPSTARIPNKHPLNKVYMGLIIKTPPSQQYHHCPYERKGAFFHCCTGWKVFDDLVAKILATKIWVANLFNGLLEMERGFVSISLGTFLKMSPSKNTGSTSVCLKVSCPKNQDHLIKFRFSNSMKALYLNSPIISGKKTGEKNPSFWWWKVHGGTKNQGLRLEISGFGGSTLSYPGLPPPNFGDFWTLRVQQWWLYENTHCFIGGWNPRVVIMKQKQNCKNFLV